MEKIEGVSTIDYTWMKPDIEIWATADEKPGNDGKTLENAFYKAKLIDVDYDKGTAVVKSIAKGSTGDQIKIAADKIFPINKISAEGYEDMVNMENLNEAELLYNVQKRFEAKAIFTYVGPTLLAINPYMKIPELFSEETLASYQKKVVAPSFSLKDGKPHIYGIAAQSFRQLMENSKKQAIVISGESGAGKTEETKYAMKFLTSMGKTINFDHVKSLFSTDTKKRSFLVINDDGNEKAIEEKILSCNPILEAFGNAKTVRNDNSSRFGKLVLLIVERDTKKIKGAVQTNYLLEKSRVISQTVGERNYHIFYQLLKGGKKELIQSLLLKEMKDYEYLRKSNCFEVKNVDDTEAFTEVSRSFDTMGFSKDEQFSIWSIVAAILHLGNLEFDDKGLDNNNPCTLIKPESLVSAASLLKINDEQLKKCFLNKTRLIGKQVIDSKMNKADCIAMKDSFTKALYERMFNWLVRKLNKTITTKEYMNTKFDDIINDKGRYSIGLLDIFGFEVFKVNSFEQFCINFANEKLQQLYISYVFKAEINEFINEGLKDFLFELNFKDNQPIIDLLEQPPMGIFNLLDESTQLASTDDALLNNIVKNHKANPNFKVPKLSKETFLIIHTAKDVEYNINGFRVKNKDELSRALYDTMVSSESKSVIAIFKMVASEIDEKEEAEEDEQNNKPKAGSKTSDKFLGAKFRLQMRNLMTELNTSDCHFVRCIKPNEVKEKNLFVPTLALQQIRYLGVLDSIKIRKESFPVRRLYQKFYERFYDLDPNSNKHSYTEMMAKNPDFRELSKEIVNTTLPGVGTNQVLFGQRKIFLRVESSNILDNILTEKIKIKTVMACRIQRSFFHYIQIKKMRKFFRALRRIQQFYRCRVELKKFRLCIKSVRKIQHAFRVKLFKKKTKKFLEKVKKMRKAVTLISATYRMIKNRRKYKKKIVKAKKINRLIRGFLGRAHARHFRMIKAIVQNVVIEQAWRKIRVRWETEAAIIIQKNARVFITKKKHWAKVKKARKAKQNVIERKAATKIQKIARGYIVRETNRRRHRCAFKIQGFIKMKWLSHLFQDLRRCVRIIQKAAKKWLLNRAIMKERWNEFFESDISSFDMIKNFEKEEIFGGKDIVKKLSGKSLVSASGSAHPKDNQSFSQNMHSTTHFHDTTTTHLKLENEQDFLNLLEDNDEDEEIIHEEGNDDGNESDILEEVLNYNAEEDEDFLKKSASSLKPSQKPVNQGGESIELDQNRKIVLFTLIIDLDFIGDTTDIYKPLWSTIFNQVKSDAAKMDSTIQLIEVGETFTIAATDSGKVFSWGSNDFFQLGRNTEMEEDRSSSGVINFNTNEAVQTRRIIAGDNHGFLVDKQGNVFCWGDNYIGQLGLGHNTINNKVGLNKMLPQKKMKDIQSKGIYNVGLTDDGKVLVWPLEKSNGKFLYKPVELPLQAGTSIASISCGNNFVMLISTTGLLYSFGKENSDGQLGHGDTNNRNLPTLVSKLKSSGEKVASVSCGFKHVICKTNLGKVYVWGAGECGQLGLGNFMNELAPRLLNLDKFTSIKNTNRVLQVKAGFKCSMVLMDNRKIYWWGTNSLLSKQTTPTVMNYNIILDLKENEKASNFIPIRILSTWSKTASVLYVTMADTSRVASHLTVTQKVCNNLSLKWEEETVDPPFIESFSRHFTMKALKKIIIQGQEKKKGPSGQKGGTPKKLTKEEKEILLEAFSLKSPGRVLQTSTMGRAKSPLRFERMTDEAKDEKLIELKNRIINLIKTPKGARSQADHEMMKPLNDPAILNMVKKI